MSFILENVPGLRHDNRLSALIRSARAIGYGVREYIVDASSFGVPQRRRRLIVLAVHGLSSREFPDSLLDALPTSFDRSAKTAGDALADVAHLKSSDPVHRFRQLRSMTVKRIKHIPIGGNRFDLPRSYQLKCHIKLRSRQCGASYGRLRIDEVAPTMTSRCTTPACGSFIHPTEHRGITLREAALIQTFPPSYKFEGGYDQIERQIGNAVPVKLAFALGLVVAKLTA
jgi:DNA (cytosine-5)-methyltransferase 1